VRTRREVYHCYGGFTTSFSAPVNTVQWYGPLIIHLLRLCKFFMTFGDGGQLNDQCCYSYVARVYTVWLYNTIQLPWFIPQHYSIIKPVAISVRGTSKCQHLYGEFPGSFRSGAVGWHGIWWWNIHFTKTLATYSAFGSFTVSWSQQIHLVVQTDVKPNYIVIARPVISIPYCLYADAFLLQFRGRNYYDGRYCYFISLDFGDGGHLLCYPVYTYNRRDYTVKLYLLPVQDVQTHWSSGAVGWAHIHSWFHRRTYTGMRKKNV